MFIYDTKLHEEGTVLKGVGGFYYIKGRDGRVHECRAKGIFRKQGEKPMPGDRVLFSPQTPTALGSLEEILPRKNSLTRPMVTNVDLLLIVIAVQDPMPDLLLCDKLLLYGLYNKIPVCIGVNKQDLAGGEPYIDEYAKSGAILLSFSAKEKTGLEELKSLMRGKFTCLAGQSAVGKSSIINALSPGLFLEVGELSKKTDRGKHTTRFTDLIQLKEIDGVVADTPGFSILEAVEILPQELRDHYHEFDDVKCRFDMCVHDKEPDCQVKRKVSEGEIPLGRYERYIKILRELEERRDRKYD